MSHNTNRLMVSDFQSRSLTFEAIYFINNRIGGVLLGAELGLKKMVLLLE